MLFLNRLPNCGGPLEPVDAEAFGPRGAREIAAYLQSRGAGAPTPLRALPGLAGELGLGEIRIKDEGARLGLGSFKALGGGYAVARLARAAATQALRREIGYQDLGAGDVGVFTSRFTFASATDGNHGRSVAEGAAFVGARCVIYVHAGVSDDRAAAIAKFGAEIVRVEGDYDQSVAEAARAAHANGWTLVSDTSSDGEDRIPLMVMQGYTALISESLAEMPEPPTHMFVQAGVGGLAAAVAAHAALALGERRPTFIVVEPERAACLYESARAGRPVLIAPNEPTVMAMLECREPSFAAWRVLSRLADAFMTVAEDEGVAVMNRLARPAPGDPPIVAGESGGVGLAGLLRAAMNPLLRTTLQLDSGSRVWLVNTEGATDPGKYRELVGLSHNPQEFTAAAHLVSGAAVPLDVAGKLAGDAP